MPRFVLSFFSEVQGLRSQLLEAETQDAALRLFFEQDAMDYSKNNEGFSYFREDFFDESRPLGSIVEIPDTIP
ncbi:MAG TPA: hypothetical protein VLM37_13040 [Fibrobacteraceae bacterium]|nr:hypothetical protein [Fibrobacteraceae bacterium]